MATAMPKTVYLGSQSTQKARMLKELNFDVIAIPAYANEEVTEVPSSIHDMVKEIAQRKVDVLLPGLKELEASERLSDILITGDVVIQNADGEVLGKPSSSEEAINWLRDYSETGSFTSYVGIQVVNLASGRQVSGSEKVQVRLGKKFDEKDILDFVKTGVPFTACGAVNINYPLFQDALVIMDGDIDSVLGMPKKLVLSLLEEVMASSIIRVMSVP